MGDYSRDPITRLKNSVARHYFGVRMQQGVPLLDADWNLLDDLRRLELEQLGARFIGNGVPVGSSGFRIAPLAGGGMGTVVLKSNMVGFDLSSVTVDLTNSTAAAALGFDANNFTTARFGTSPAQLTGNRAEPFSLDNGSTLVIQADALPSETVTFVSGDFADITAATSAEVVAAINAVVTQVTAMAGTGNDFIIKGGDGTFERAGRILIEGQMVLNERDLKYTEQALYKNAELASRWGVNQVAELTTPAASEQYFVFLDVFYREVNSEEDPDLVDIRIGIETAIRLRHEWAVRVTSALDYPAELAGKPIGHNYYVLAELQRMTGDPAIDSEMILDERATDVALEREIAYRDLNDAVLVDSESFRSLLIATRSNVRDFIEFLTTKFVDPASVCTAGEILGMDALGAVSVLAEQGIALLNAKSLSTKGALAFFQQLLDVENRFVSVWETSVFPIEKPSGKVYEIAYTEMLDRIKSYLSGPAPASFMSISDALARRNLWEAVRSQEQINTEFGQEIGRPTGFLTLSYHGSPTPTIIKNQNFDLHFEISGSVTPDDDIDVEVFINAAWQVTLRNADGSIPLELHLGPGEDSAEFIVTILAPNVDAAETQISLQVNARRNKGGLKHISTQKTLRIGDPPPPSEEDYIITISSTNVSQVGGIFQVPTSSAAIMNLRFYNNTNTVLVADLEYEPLTAPPWTIMKGSFSLEDQSIPAKGQVDYPFQFIAPATPANTLIFIFRAKNADTSALIAEIQITLTSITS